MITLDWGSTDLITYGQCWTEAYPYVFDYDTGEWGSDAYSLGLRDAQAYAEKLGVLLLVGPARYVDWSDLGPPSFVWPIAMIRKKAQ